MIKKVIVLSVITLGFLFISSATVQAADNYKVYYFHQDHLSSTGLVTAEDGSIVSRKSYYAYGDTKAQEGTYDHERQFTSQIHDSESDLYYYNARYYSTKTGRFLTADTQMGPNRYAYVDGNPVNKNDPTGNKPPPGRQPPKSSQSGVQIPVINYIIYDTIQVYSAPGVYKEYRTVQNPEDAMPNIEGNYVYKPTSLATNWDGVPCFPWEDPAFMERAAHMSMTAESLWAAENIAINPYTDPVLNAIGKIRGGVEDNAAALSQYRSEWDRMRWENELGAGPSGTSVLFGSGCEDNFWDASADLVTDKWKSKAKMPSIYGKTERINVLMKPGAVPGLDAALQLAMNPPESFADMNAGDLHYQVQILAGLYDIVGQGYPDWLIALMQQDQEWINDNKVSGEKQ